MPGASFYDDLSLAEKVRKFAEHHSDPLVRHISQDEASFLKSAAAAADGAVTPGRIGRAVGGVGLVLVSAYVVYGKRQAKAPRKGAGLPGYVGKEVIVTTAGGPNGESTQEIRGVLESVTERGIVLREEQGQEEFLLMPAIRGVKDGDGRAISEGW